MAFPRHVTIRVICPMAFLGCNWQGTFESPAEAAAAEAAHWAKKHVEVTDADEPE